jgi:hypothetical protein
MPLARKCSLSSIFRTKATYNPPILTTSICTLPVGDFNHYSRPAPFGISPDTEAIMGTTAEIPAAKEPAKKTKKTTRLYLIGKM